LSVPNFVYITEAICRSAKKPVKKGEFFAIKGLPMRRFSCKISLLAASIRKHSFCVRSGYHPFAGSGKKN